MYIEAHTIKLFWGETAMRVPFKKLAIATAGSIALAVLFIVLYIVLNAFIGSSALSSFLAVSAMVLIILSGALAGLMPIFGVIEVLASKNDTAYKILWTLALFFLGFIGLAAYLLIGRKELK
jgi:hypothetical protein